MAQQNQLAPILSSDALEAGIYNENEWLTLGHYSRVGGSEAWMSDIDDTAFFLASDGATDPAAELSANIIAMFSDSDQAVRFRCQFPARWHWLQERLEQKIAAPAEACTEFRQWRDEIGASAATLVFPAAYLDSPSSMFGHTLLRLDKSPDQDNSQLLSYSVSYAARKSDEDSELAFVYRGLVGGYPGDISIIPYYLKIREYSEIESRDIWEYRLRLDEDQIAQLVRHLWEVKDLRIDYYFFSENCSYRLLALLNVVVPEHSLMQQYPIYTIPVATVRGMYHLNLIENVEYRPSVATRFKHMLSQLDSTEQQLVYQLSRDASEVDLALEGLTESTKARVLEVAFTYARMLPPSELPVRNNSLSLLTARSLLKGSASLSEVNTPDPRDDQGHESERFSLGRGTDMGRHFTSFELRPSYHDLTDPADGYPIGSRLVFSSATLRHFDDDAGIQVDEYQMISIASIKGRDRFFQPTSWAVEIGANRDTLDRSQRLTPQLWGQVGRAWEIGPELLGYGLLGAELSVGTRLEGNLDIASRPQVGLLWRGHKFQSHLSIRYRDSVIHNFKEEQQLALTLVANINSRLSLSANIQQDIQDSNSSTYSLGLQYFH